MALCLCPNTHLWAGVARCWWESLGIFQRKEIEDIRQETQRLVDSKYYPDGVGDALRNLDKFLVRNPNNREALALRGALRFQERRLHGEAIEDFQKILAMEPDNVHIRYLLVALLMDPSRKQLPEAIDLLSSHIRANPQDAQAHFMRGVAHLSLSRTQDALDDIGQAITLGVGDNRGEANFYRAMLHIHRGHTTAYHRDIRISLAHSIDTKIMVNSRMATRFAAHDMPWVWSHSHAPTVLQRTFPEQTRELIARQATWRQRQSLGHFLVALGHTLLAQPERVHNHILEAFSILSLPPSGIKDIVWSREGLLENQEFPVVDKAKQLLGGTGGHGEHLVGLGLTLLQRYKSAGDYFDLALHRGGGAIVGSTDGNNPFAHHSRLSIRPPYGTDAHVVITAGF